MDDFILQFAKQNYLDHFNTDNFLSVLNINLKLYGSMLMDQYIYEIKTIIVEVLNDTLSIKKILNNGDISSNVIIALMLFLKSPSFSSNEELRKNLESYDTNMETRRIVLMFYNALNGYAALDSSSKSDSFLNRVCENYAFKLTKSKYLVSENIDDLKFMSYNPKDNHTFYTSTNIPFKCQFHYTEDEILSEKCRQSVKNLINKDSNITKKILNSFYRTNSRIMNLLPIKVYIEKIHIDDFINNEEKIAFSISNQSLIKKEIDVFKFVEIIFSNPRLFLNLFVADSEIWNSYIS